MKNLIEIKREMGVISLASFHPGFILIFFGIFSLVFSMFCKCNSKLVSYITVGGSLIAFLATLILEDKDSWIINITEEIKLSLLNVDNLSKLFAVIFGFIALVSSIYSLNPLTKSFEKAVSLIYAGASMSVVLSDDWISFIVFWELMAVTSMYMVYAGDSKDAKRASFRYMVMHFTAGNLIMAGAIFIIKSGNYELLPLTYSGGPQYWLILIGLLINCAMFPFHTWLPDSYPEANPSGTVYMGSFTTKVAIYSLIRLFSGTEEFAVYGALVAIFAALMAFIENDIRRLLSYHIVSQLGMMLSAIAIGDKAGDMAAAFHASFNILYKGVLLMIAGAIFYMTGKKNISDLGGILKGNPIISICFFIASLCIAGFPLTNGYVSKGMITAVLTSHGYIATYYLIMIAGIGTWISITMKINYFVFIKPSKTLTSGETKEIPAAMNIAIVATTTVCLIAGFLYGRIETVSGFNLSSLLTASHICEYLFMFVAATVPFVLLRKKVEPHEGLNLDIDIAYRIGLSRLLLGLSSLVNKIFEIFERWFGYFKYWIYIVLKYPQIIAGERPDMKERTRDEMEEVPTSVGGMINALIFFAIVAFIVLVSIEG